MEKKTIGGFIATLRKANGMTQKDLAQRLNVSDKTVSRWERDDGAPDLAVIPIIAEIFDVTCDELLRGERRSPSQRDVMPEVNESTPKGEKERQRLLKASLSQYKDMTYIAMGVSVIGMIAVLICNLVYIRASLGFFVGAIFFVASIICQAVFVNKAFLKVEDAELDIESHSDYKRKVIGLAKKSIGVTMFFIGFSFPLVFVDPYWGMDAETMFCQGIISAAIFLVIYIFVLHFLDDRFVKKGIYILSDKELEKYTRKRELKKKYFKKFAIVLVITLVIHSIGVGIIWDPDNIGSFIVFDDYENFVEFMEKDVPEDELDDETVNEHNGNFSVIIEDVPEDEEDDYEEFEEKIYDADGKVVCTYIDRNQSVDHITYKVKEGTVLPIEVITKTEARKARDISDKINWAYTLLYPIELIAILGGYIRKKANWGGNCN